MKRLFCILTSVSITSIASGQSVGINNPSPAPSAILDVVSTDKGLLIPRMTSVQRLAIPAPATGLLVYETTTNQFFYFNGTAWISLTTGGAGWLLTGNAGTTSSNFIGTTDNQPLRIKVNGISSGLIDHINFNAFIGVESGDANTGTGNAFFGYQAGMNNTSANANSFFGRGAGRSTTTTGGNSFFGHNAGQFNTGSINSFFGTFAGSSNITGSENSFYGGVAGGNNTSGSRNTYIGRFAGNVNTTGNDNTLLGYRADLSTGSLTNSTAIGTRSRVDGSNSLVLGSVAGINGATSSVTVGIGTTNPNSTSRLHVMKGSSGAISLNTSDVAIFENSASTFIRVLTPNTSTSGIVFDTSPFSQHGSVLYNHSSKSMSFSTLGATKMTLNSTGDLGIGTGVPTQRLHIVGKIRMVDGTQAAGRVLTSDAAGVASWQNLPSGGITGVTSSNGLNSTGGSNPDIQLGGTLTSTTDINLNSNNLTFSGNGNVGVGTTTPSDKLHVAGSIRLVDGNQAAGKLLTSDANGTASWQTVNAIMVNAWGLNGNGGTTFTNFIGTTDTQPLRFKVNNIHAGSVGVSTLTTYGFETGISGNASSFFGAQSGRASAGNNNSFFGANSGEFNSGSNNSYFGSQAGVLGSSSSNANTFIGAFAGVSNTLGSNNTYIGKDAGLNLSNGNNNTLIGFNSRALNSVFNSSAIGANARVDINNALVLGAVPFVNGAGSTPVNVGIGTTTPLERLHVVGKIRMNDGSQAINRILVSDANGTATWQDLTPSQTNAWGLFGNAITSSPAHFIGTTNTQDFIFRTANIERMRITTGGIVSIGSSSPLSFVKLDVTNSSLAARFFNNANSGVADVARIHGGSNTSSGSWMIDFRRNDNTQIGRVEQTAIGAVSYFTTSDSRLKNLKSETQLGLNELMKINIYDYTYKSDPGNNVITGFAAQELYDIFPQSVSKPREQDPNSPEENPWMVDYGSISPLIIKAIQDQQNIIENLQKKVIELESWIKESGK